MRVNKLRKALAGDKPIFGMGFYSQSLAIMEIIGHSGFDFVFIDCEHAPLASTRSSRTSCARPITQGSARSCG